MRNALRRYVGRRVVAQVGEDSVGGILDAAGDELILSDAALLDGQQATPLDGVVVIPSLSVRWVQVT